MRGSGLSGGRTRLSPVAERVSESEHDDFGDGDALDEQEGAIGAEDPQRAFDLAPPVKRQFAGDDFDELKLCVRSARPVAGHKRSSRIAGTKLLPGRPVLCAK